MSEKNRMSEVNGASGELNPDITRVELTDTQGLAVHLMQEREVRQSTVLEMNELLRDLDKAQAECAALRRALYQERLNGISRDNADLRKQYNLPDGSTQYQIEDGKMFLLKGKVSE